MERRDFLTNSSIATAGFAIGACGKTVVNAEPQPPGPAGGVGQCSALTLMAPAQPAIIGPGEGELLDDEDGRYKIRVADLGNYWSIMEMTLAAKQLLAPHTHENYDQAVYLIEGELGFEFGGKGGTVLRGGAGSYVLKPRGLSHTFWNPGDTVVRYIEMSANVTFERFADAARKSKTPIETQKTAKEHDVTFHYDQILRLMREHGLTSVKGSAIRLPDLEELNLPKPGGPVP